MFCEVKIAKSPWKKIFGALGNPLVWEKPKMSSSLKKPYTKHVKYNAYGIIWINLLKSHHCYFTPPLKSNKGALLHQICFVEILSSYLLKTLWAFVINFSSSKFWFPSSPLFIFCHSTLQFTHRSSQSV